MDYELSFKHRRKSIANLFIRYLAYIVLFKFFYKVSVTGEDFIPEKGPALLIPKHISNLDTFLIGAMVHHVYFRPLYFLMKATIPKPIEAFGGIRIARVKDFRSRKKYSKRKNNKWKKSLQANLPKYCEWLYKQDEIIVSYPEGKRTPDRVGKIHTTSIEHVQQLGYDIPIIPIGIEYEDKNKYRSKVHIRIGIPIDIPSNYSEEELASLIGATLKKLSRIN
jgi:1-acyl-sn-glycerol-3-phosphate acyltransferase